MDLICATHGHCFDGLSSAVLFHAFARQRHPELTFRVLSCGYGPKQTQPTEASLSGVENVILDFKYLKSERLTYYFDHHKTAFPEPDDRANFDEKARSQPDRFVYDADATSCTLLLQRVLTEKHGVDLSAFGELVQWADWVDSARFPSAAAATDASNPVLQLVSIVEQFGDDALFQKLVPRLADEDLLTVAKSPLVVEKYKAIAPDHDAYRRLVVEKGEMRGRVVYLDLTGHRVRAVTKFAAYASFPDSTYSVIVSELSSGVKIAVGHNPWSGQPREHDISAICARYGGGGHPVVGGIALPKGEAERGREIARTIAEELA